MLPVFTRMWKIEPTMAEKKEAVLRLIDESSPSGGFYVMLIAAAVIVAVGLMMGNESIVIGGMLVSPLLAPFLAFGLGVAMGDRTVMIRSVWIIALTSIVVYVITFILGLLFPFDSVNVEILSRVEPSIGFSLVALFAGLAGSFSYVKPKLNAILPGVAIAIAVLPPLSVSALGVVLWDADIIFGALSLYLLNLVGIVLASIVVFSVFGFYPLRNRAELEVKKEQRNSTTAKEIVQKVEESVEKKEDKS